MHTSASPLPNAPRARFRWRLQAAVALLPLLESHSPPSRRCFFFLWLVQPCAALIRLRWVRLRLLFICSLSCFWIALLLIYGSLLHSASIHCKTDKLIFPLCPCLSSISPSS